jgi:HD superfamily phosphohydrolase
MPIPRRFPISFKVDEPLPDSPGYLILQADPPPADPSDTASPLGEGGAGVVYLALFKGRIQRAIKFLSPAARLDHIDIDRFQDTFNRELVFLAELTHTHIAKLTDLGSSRLGDHEVQWFAMDYIDGVRPTELWSDPDFAASSDGFVTLIAQLLDAVGYLHAQGVMHCDIKNDNIRVRRAGPTGFSLTLLDLGVAKRIDTNLVLDADGQERRTYFFSSPHIVRPRWSGYLQRPIPVGDLRAMFPGHDFFAIGKLLQELLQTPRSIEVLTPDLGQEGLRAIEIVRDRLLNEGDPRTDYYTDMRTLRSDWDKVRREYTAPLRTQELSPVATSRHSVVLPTGRVALTARMTDVIRHPLVQRLHDIPQLELLHMLYPGARHSRFLHSLGVFQTAREYLAHLLGDPVFRLLVEPTDVQATLLRALLHDIGHYPLSHMFEDFAEEERDQGTARRVPTDDELFWPFIEAGATPAGPFAPYGGMATEAAQALTGMAPDRLHDLIADPRRFGPDVLTSMGKLVSPTTESHCVLAGIISSPLDADKVSYLRDDSYMSGVPYGAGVDFAGLLNALRSPASDDAKAGPVIAISEAGVSAAESIVLARQWMLQRVYWHPMNRGMMGMVKYVVGHLLHADPPLDMVDYVQRTLFGTPADGLRHLSAEFDRVCGTSDFRNPLHGVRAGAGTVYRRLFSIRAEDSQNYEKLARRDWQGLEDLLAVLIDALGGKLPGKVVRRGDLVIDIPRKRREPMSNRGRGVQQEGRALMYTPGSDVGRDVIADPSVSPLLAGHKTSFDMYIKECAVFLHPVLMDSLGERHAEIARELRDLLIESLNRPPEPRPT